MERLISDSLHILENKFRNKVFVAFVAEKTKVRKRKEKVEVQIESKGSDDEDISYLKKITALLAKAFNRKKYYAKPTNNNLRTSLTSSSANKKPEYVKSVEKKEDKRADEKKRDMSKVKCYNCKKERHFAKDCKKAKVKDYNYYKTKMLLAKKDSDKQVLSNSGESSLSAEETIAEVAYYTSESESESEYETSEYYDNSTNYGLFMNDNDDREIFHDTIESASENFIENHIDSQKDYDKSENAYLLAQTEDLQDQLKVNHVVIDTHTECQAQYAKLEEERYEYMIRYSALCDNDKQHMKKIDEQEILFDKTSLHHSKLNKDVKQYSRKNLLSCNNSHLGETSSAYVYNDAMNVSCNSRLCDSFDENILFIFDDESVRISHVSKMPFRKKPRNSLNIVQICLWIIDSGCSKHMTGNRALLTNFVGKFLGTVRFGNNDFAVIAGYGDVAIGSMTIKKVYYVEGLGHNLFSVGQFCDKGLEVAFRKSTCFVRNDDGVDLLAGDRSSNLYTIALNEVASISSIFLIAKASSSQSWLWHQHLSHLNFTTINNLVKNNLVQGLPKMKFEKDHLCSACKQGKIHQKHHKSKMAFASNKPFYLLHMDLSGSMRVESINGKRYVLVSCCR
nr:integrase, catalytic region, zinc finger, CCHC-type, peptidase aspartic, catalytic [Tanacetum cinerariifolium]